MSVTDEPGLPVAAALAEPAGALLAAAVESLEDEVALLAPDDEEPEDEEPQAESATMAASPTAAGRTERFMK
ncbi:MAG TPA: hypothetical protein VFN73_09620 [Propionibacteriaceae bacterium]|nr:hypothetical protein [Propionibacteriaceae bacterium]